MRPDIFDIYLPSIAWGVYELPEVISTDCTAELHSDPIRRSNAAYHREWVNDHIEKALSNLNYIFALPPEGVTRRLDKPADQCMTYSPALRTYNDARGYDRRIDYYWFNSREWVNGYIKDILTHYYWASLPDRPTYARQYFNILPSFKPDNIFEYTPGVTL